VEKTTGMPRFSKRGGAAGALKFIIPEEKDRGR